jgi:hypothetical protein
LPTGHQPTAVMAWHQLTSCSDRTPLALRPAPPDKERRTFDHAADLEDRLHNIHNYAYQYLKLVKTEWKLVTTGWPTVRATKRATMCGSIGPPARKGNHQTFNPDGRAHTG